MIAFRTMTYAINGGRGSDGRRDLDRIGELIHQADADIVALQGVTAEALDHGLRELPFQLGMAAFGFDTGSGLAFLARAPLKGLDVYDLGDSGRCLRSDYVLHDRRMHLFNLQLSLNPLYRKNQLQALQCSQLLGNPRLTCPVVVHGDFALALPDPGQMALLEICRRAQRPLWRATYPARCPLWGRDRIYLQGPVRELAGRIPRSRLAREASPHLPLILDLQVTDTRTYLPLERVPDGRKVPAVTGPGM